MAFQLDHVVIAVNDLDTAIRDYGDLGFTVTRGGVHANRATHNALVTFGNGTYLELLAATGETPLPGVIDFSVLLQAGEGLAGFALRSDDLDADDARLRAEGFAVSESIPGERRRNDGTVIQWKLALLDGGFAPFLIQDVTPRRWRISDDPAVTTHPNRVTGLHGVEIATHEGRIALEWYAKLFSAAPQSDMANTLAVGNVILREISQRAEYPAGLFAVQLIHEQAGTLAFPPEQTHGVRFEQ